MLTTHTEEKYKNMVGNDGDLENSNIKGEIYKYWHHLIQKFNL